MSWQPIQGDPPRISTGALVAALSLVALVHAALWTIHYTPTARALVGDEVIYWQAASDLLAGAEAQLDLLWPPLYPRLLALLSRAGGGSILIVQLAQGLMLVAAALILRAIALRLGASPAAAALAGLLSLAYPPLAAYSHYLWPEILHLLLFLAALWILIARAASWPWMPVLGVSLGLALLTKSLLAPFLPLLLIGLLLEGGWRRRLACLALALAALAATLAPTLVSNHRRSGQWLIAGSATFNVWVGLNDRSRRNLVDSIAWQEYLEFRDSAASHGERNRILRGKIRALVAERGLAAVLRSQLGRQYFRLFDRDSFLTDQLPGGRVWDDGGGYRAPPPAIAGALRLTSYALYAAILTGAVFGWLVYRPRGGAWPRILLAFLAYNLLLFLVIHVKTRFRIQLLPVLLLGLAFTADRLLGARRPPPGRWQAPLAAAVSLLILALAFLDVS